MRSASLSLRCAPKTATVLLDTCRDYLRSAVFPGADAVCVAGHRFSLCWFLLPAGTVGRSWADLVSAAAWSAHRQSQSLEKQPEGCVWYTLDLRPYSACSDGGDDLSRRRTTQTGLTDHCISYP